jgi:hypothetical protein
VADNLNNPRQIAAHDDALYVAEAGTGGPNCMFIDAPANTVQVCYGFTSSVTKVSEEGDATRVQTGLFSVLGPEGDITGLDAVAFHGNRLYGVVTGGCLPPTFVLPADVAAQFGKVLRLKGGTSFTAIGDPGSFECAHDPDQLGPDTDPYGLAIRGNTFYVADAAGNDLVKVRNGTTSLATLITSASNPQQVPTSLAWGPDHKLYIGTLNFENFGHSSIYRYDPETGALDVYATDLTAVTALAFGAHGKLYVTEWTTAFGATGPSPDGDVIAIPWGGGQAGRQTLGTGDLHFPTGVAVLDGEVYVSNWGIQPGSGPGPHGQLVKLNRSHDD